MTVLRNFLLVLLTPLMVFSAAQAQPVDGGHARVELISERALAVPGETVWFGLSFEIDPNCRLSKQENTLQIRFSYQNRTFRGRTNSKNDFLLMQLPDQKWVYDLKTPLHIWLDKHL